MKFIPRIKFINASLNIDRCHQYSQKLNNQCKIDQIHSTNPLTNSNIALNGLDTAISDSNGYN